MTYVWDTNILLQVLRSQDFYDMLNRQYDFTNPLNEVCISIVSVGEINAIALRNRWGTARLGFLSATLQTLKTVFIVTIAVWNLPKKTIGYHFVCSNLQK